MTVTGAYSFPNTDAPYQRLVKVFQVHSNGTTTLRYSGQQQQQTGQYSFTMDTTCWTPGTYTLRATADACAPEGDDQKETTFTIPRREVALTPTLVLPTLPSAVEIEVDYNFPDSDSTQRRINFYWSATDRAPETFITGFSPAARRGIQTVGFARLADRDGVTIRAVACGTDETTAFVPLQDYSCRIRSSSFGDPIRAATGNMRYTEHDPLPAAEFSGLLSRTYDSSNGGSRAFGRGWTSPFDAWLRISGTTAVVSSEQNDRSVFQQIGGVYIQVWPTDEPYADTLTAASGGMLEYRKDRGDLVRVYRASDGRLIAYRYLSSGREMRVEYDAAGLPLRLRDSDDRWQWNVVFDAVNSRITSLNVDGRPDINWTYMYDGVGNLATVLAPDGQPWRTYTYSGPYLAEVRDALGNLIESHNYDAAGRAITSFGPSGEITNVEYDLPGRVPGEIVTRVTHASGLTSLYYIRYSGGRARTVEVDGGCSSCGAGRAVYGYDADGRLVREQNARGFITVRTYDARSLVTESGPWSPAACDPLTSSSHCLLSPDTIMSTALAATPATMTTHYVYGDAAWPARPTIVTSDSVLGGAGATRSESFVYDGPTGEVLRRQVIGWTLMSGVPAPEVRTSTTNLYDGTATAVFTPCANAMGTCAFSSSWLALPQPVWLRKSVVGPRTDVNEVTEFVWYPFDSTVPATWRGRLAATRGATGLITRFENYDVFGKAGKTVDPNGVVTESTTDAAGRTLTTTLKGVPGCDTSADPLCATDLVTTNAYAPGAGPLTSVTRPGGGVASFEYEGRGRLWATTRLVAAGRYERMETEYDVLTGKKSSEKAFGGAPGAWLQTRSQTFQYDVFGRLKSMEHPDGAKVLYTYDAADQVASVQDERHTAPNTRYRYDEAGRLATVEQTLASAPGGVIPTSYGYDLHGNLTSVTDPNGNVTTYLYDDFGQMLRQTSPVTGVTTYAYDAAKNLISDTDANGATTIRSYDALGRVLNATSTAPNTPQETVTWSYDESARSFAAGRLTTMTDGTGRTEYEYERRGLLRREAKTVGTALYITAFRYDRDGNRSAIVYPSATTVTQGYDFAGRPVSASYGSVPLVTSATYLPFGPATQVRYGNATVKDVTFDARYRISETMLTGSQGVIARYGYGYDPASNITRIDDLVDASYSRGFGYDDLGRLTSTTSGVALWGSGSYQYDAMGSITSLSLGTTRSSTFAYQGVTPKLSSVTENGTSRAVQYDAAGNERTVGAESFAYSARNSLIAAPEATYEYDGRGIRTVTALTTAGSPRRVSLYTSELKLMAETATTTATQLPVEFEYVWLNGEPLAQIELPGGTVSYYYNDHLGAPLLQTDGVGSVVWRVESEAYGERYVTRTGASRHQPLGLPGQEYDASSERLYNVFRWYRPGWGRYSQADPMALDGGTNLYGYGAQNPTNFVDPLGLLSWPGALAHYLAGSGDALDMDFNEINTSGARAIEFPQVASALRSVRKNGNECCPMTREIDGRRPFATSGDQALFLGSITLRLRGRLTVYETCLWVVEGTLGAFSDLYDFNRSSHRSRVGEALTTLGRWMPGEEFWINIRGRKRFVDSGRIP